jgi:BirA family transcriptional regulator, biotin operon repressor / biotin---[acetyl-CoA-carboxylase] ligase
MGISRIICYDETDSTNLIARELIAEGCLSGTVVRAGRQSGGRGQYGRTFSSPPGGLYFSIVLQPDLQPEFLPLITLATGLAVCEVIMADTGLGAMIKWPNDLYIGDRKVAGILCESMPEPRRSSPPKHWIIIGVGLNVNSELCDFPSELHPILTTLRVCSERTYDLDIFFQELVEAIVASVGLVRHDRSRMLKQWQVHDYLFNKKIVYSSGAVSLEGVGQGIGPEGGYRLRDAQHNVHTIIGGQLRPHAGSVDVSIP